MKHCLQTPKFRNENDFNRMKSCLPPFRKCVNLFHSHFSLMKRVFQPLNCESPYLILPQTTNSLYLRFLLFSPLPIPLRLFLVLRKLLKENFQFKIFGIRIKMKTYYIYQTFSLIIQFKYFNSHILSYESQKASIK